MPGLVWHLGAAVALPQSTGSLDVGYFGAQSRGPLRSLSTLRGWITLFRARLAPRLVANLCRAGLSPAGFAAEGFSMVTSSVLLLQA
jgi:hypothetical protein